MPLPERPEHVIYKSGRTVVLELGLREDQLSGPPPARFERPSAQHAVSAISEFSRGLVQPLEFGMRKYVVDEDTWMMPSYGRQPEKWHWYLRQVGLSPDPFYVDPVVVDAGIIDENAMLTLVDTALDEPCELVEGQWPAWDEMYIWNVLVRVPESIVPPNANHLVLDDYDNGNPHTRVTLERRPDGSWVTHPGLGVWPPMTLRVSKSAGSSHPDAATFDEILDLQIDVHWSLWWEEGSPGRATLDAALDRLHERGWRTTFHSDRP